MKLIIFLLLCTVVKISAHSLKPLQLAPLLQGNALRDIIELNLRFQSSSVAIIDDAELHVEELRAIRLSVGSIKLSWKNVTRPSDSDFIAFYCSQYDETEKLHDIGIFDVVNATVALSWPYGYGHARLSLPEISCDKMRAAFIQLGPNGGFVQRASAPVSRAVGSSSLSPYHLRVAYGNDPGEVYISWTSRANASVGSPIIYLGNSPGNMTAVSPAASETLTYTAEEMCRQGQSNMMGGMKRDIP